MTATRPAERAQAKFPREGLEWAQSPVLLVWLDAVRHNIRVVLRSLGGDPDRWRPHLKTTKLPIVWNELMAAGLRSFKCATTREAATFIELVRNQDTAELDLLVAYPHRGANLARINQLAQSAGGVRLAALCEDVAHLDEFSPSLGVFIDLNSGMNRTGIPLDDRDAIEAVARHAGRRFRGLHFYDGHIRSADPTERRQSVYAGLARLAEIIEWLQSRGLAVAEAVTSGTPGFLDAAASGALGGAGKHSVSPGTVVFHDECTRELLPGLDLQPAAMVLTRIISHPAPDIVTCDAGSKSLAAEAGDPCCRVVDHPELTALKPSEEHLPLRLLESATPPARGDTLLLVPRHVCPTVNMADEAIIIEDGGGRSIERITARGHEIVS